MHLPYNFSKFYKYNCQCKRLFLPVSLPRDGILVSDNVLQDGDVIESRFAVERRNRTIHARMREYLYELTHCGELRTSVLPLGDGITVSVRTQKEE